MAKIRLQTNKKDSEKPQIIGRVASLCDPTQTVLPEQVREEREVEIKDIKERYRKFKEARESTVVATAASFRLKTINAANFLLADIQKIIDNTKDVTFLRVYNGIDENGDYIMMVAPVDSNKVVIETNGTIYVEQCCSCPPHQCDFANVIAP